MQSKIFYNRISVFFYDLFFLRNTSLIFYLIKISSLLFWIYFRFIDKTDRNYFYLRAEIFGEQLAQFQSLNQFALDSKTSISYNFHPVIKGEFIIHEQVRQLSTLHNVKRCSHLKIILRLFSDSLDNSISKRFQLKQKFIISSLREKGYGSNFQNFSKFEAFPKFNATELSSQREYLQSEFTNILDDSLLVAVNSRTGNFQKYRKFPKENMDFRNTNFHELAQAIKNSHADKLQYLRIGQFENDSVPDANLWIDTREKIAEDEMLQLSCFNSCDAYFGSSNGPISYFVAQKKPCLAVSVYPIDLEYPIEAESMVVIPKMIWKRSEGKFMELEEQFSLDFSKIQNLYNDKLLIDKNLYPISISKLIINEVYSDWVSSILFKMIGSDWLDKSIEATNKLREKTNRPNLPVIPHQYFKIAQSLNS